jgi:PII-like signaling protein
MSLHKGFYLKFYVPQKEHRHGRVLYEWLLEEAKKLGLHGGSAFRAAAGFGRHGRLHEDTFFELASDLPVEVGFVVDDLEAAKLLAFVEAEGLRIFFVKYPVEYGVTGKPTAGEAT